MPKIKPPTVRQCGTQYAVKKHGVVYSKADDTYGPTTLCGRKALNTTTRKFDPASYESCGRCVRSYNKQYAA